MSLVIHDIEGTVTAFIVCTYDCICSEVDDGGQPEGKTTEELAGLEDHFFRLFDEGTHECLVTRNVLDDTLVDHGDHGGDQERRGGGTHDFLGGTFERSFHEVVRLR